MKIKMQFSPVDIEISDAEIANALKDHLEQEIERAIRAGCDRFYHKRDEGEAFPKIVSMIEEALEGIDDTKLVVAIRKRLTTKLTTGIVKAIADR